VVNETQRYSGAEVERMMKVQDVLLKARRRRSRGERQQRFWGVTDRTMRRWREKLDKDGRPHHFVSQSGQITN
jgi:hypothetical protein